MIDPGDPTPDAGDAPPEPGPDRPETAVEEPGVHSFDIDIAAYLPEGVELADDDGADAVVEDEDEDDAEDEVTGRVEDDAEDDAEDEVTGGAGAETPSTHGGDGSGREDADEVDTALLEELEAELDEVDAALTAIDDGEAERSPLLRRLLGENPGA